MVLSAGPYIPTRDCFPGPARPLPPAADCFFVQRVPTPYPSTFFHEKTEQGNGEERGGKGGGEAGVDWARGEREGRREGTACGDALAPITRSRPHRATCQDGDPHPHCDSQPTDENILETCQHPPNVALRPPLPPLLQSPRRRARSLARTARLRFIVFRCDFALGIPSARCKQTSLFLARRQPFAFPRSFLSPLSLFSPLARALASAASRRIAHCFFFSAAAFEAHFRLFFPPSSSRVLVGSSPALSTLMVNVCENHDSTLATLVST